MSINDVDNYFKPETMKDTLNQSLLGSPPKEMLSVIQRGNQSKGAERDRNKAQHLVDVH